VITGLAADRKGNVYVLESDGIYQFDGATGKQIRKAGGVYFNAIAPAPGERVAAATQDGGLIIFDDALKAVKTFKDAGRQANTTFGFSEIAVSGDNIIYTVDRHTGEICKYSRAENF
jgi:hypothetical protein